MKRLLAGFAVLIFVPIATAQDAQLPEKIVVKDLQGGFAGLTGKQWTVDKNGKWEEATVGPRQKLTVVRSGSLKPKEIETLAAELKKYDAGTLKNQGREGTNPKVVEITFGKNTAKLVLKTGSPLPKVDAKTNDGRFAGVVESIKTAIPAKKAGE